MPRPKALILALTGSALILVAATVPVPHPMFGVLIGSALLLVGLCVLVRKPKPESDEEEVKRQIDFNQ